MCRRALLHSFPDFPTKADKRARVVLPASQFSVLRATNSSVMRIVWSRRQMSGICASMQKAAKLICWTNLLETPAVSNRVKMIVLVQKLQVF